MRGNFLKSGREESIFPSSSLITLKKTTRSRFSYFVDPGKHERERPKVVGGPKGKVMNFPMPKKIRKKKQTRKLRKRRKATIYTRVTRGCGSLQTSRFAPVIGEAPQVLPLKCLLIQLTPPGNFWVYF